MAQRKERRRVARLGQAETVACHKEGPRERGVEKPRRRALALGLIGQWESRTSRYREVRSQQRP